MAGNECLECREHITQCICGSASTHRFMAGDEGATVVMGLPGVRLPPSRPAYQTRVIAELTELDRNIALLANFIGQPTAINVISPTDRVYGAQEFGRLSAQLVLMKSYADILRERVKHFRE